MYFHAGQALGHVCEVTLVTLAEEKQGAVDLGLVLQHLEDPTPVPWVQNARMLLISSACTEQGFAKDPLCC